MLLSFITLSVTLLVLFGQLSRTVLSETFSEMTAPPRHKGVFFKKQTGLNKTIPYSENPGKEMIVFDVDGTLWPYHIDSDPIFQDPFVIKSVDNGTVFVGNHTIHIFPEVEETLVELIEKGYVLAAVSLTNSTHKTMALLNAFDLSKHFKHMEMAPEPDKLSLVTEICTRSGLLLEDVLYFEKDPGEVFDMLWKHVIVYCIDENGLTKDRARKGLLVFDIRPRKERRQHLKSEKREFTDKNKSRPAKERDGTELEGMIHNGSAIDYQ
uniref:Magnesium-dependent phosphatase-1 n=1 Tax=Graphocephala atropunctata TaxID=36148 RepID=A0A1B6KZL2_9HEMI